jgi:hypothetical protein
MQNVQCMTWACALHSGGLTDMGVHDLSICNVDVRSVIVLCMSMHGMDKPCV